LRKDDHGVLVSESTVGDRVQAVVVSTEGGLTRSRRLARGAATDQQLEEVFHARRREGGEYREGGRNVIATRRASPT
jgi:hypothetical protein